MAVVSGRTRMSSRGQVVIPKFLREAAGMKEGEEIHVVLDGQRLILSSGTKGEIKPEATADAPRVAEAGLEYAISRAAAAHKSRDGQPLSKVWADRIQALATLKRVLSQMPAIDVGDLLAASRRELEGRGATSEGGEDRG